MSSLDVARQVADAVLFEGYLLYPYRASAAKNQVRWQFGVLAPRGAATDEPSYSQTDCLVEPGPSAALELTVRFLQVRRRTGPVPWDEGVAREVTTVVQVDSPREIPVEFEIPGSEEADREVTWRCQPLNGVIRVRPTPLEGPYGLVKVRVQVHNLTVAPDTAVGRDDLLPYSMVAAHSLLVLRDGEFVSLLDPPQWAAPAAAGCENLRTWPVLVGAGRDAMLSSPIILYDYPEVARESPAEFHDSTEIDELLTLRTLTLTDEEKAAARATDPRAAAIVDRVEAMPREVLERLHGAVRYLRRVTDPPPSTVEATWSEPAQPWSEPAQPWSEPAQPWWDPGSDRSVSPETDRLAVDGGWASQGSRVRLHPRVRGTDAQDMFLRDRLATVRAVLFDVDGSGHLAVTLDDDPAAELHQWYGRFLYFAPEEVELA